MSILGNAWVSRALRCPGNESKVPSPP
jgi:hypothetical protein